MTTKLIFLGTSGDNTVASKQLCASGGIIIDVNNNQFHLNPGPGTLVRANQNNINLRQNIAVLISSPILNNYNDLNMVIESMTYSGLDRHGVIIAIPELIEKVIHDEQKNQISRIIQADPNKKLAIENVEIFILKTTNEKSLGYKFFTPSCTITYTGETGFNEELIEQYKDSEILIMNIPNPGDMDTKDKLNTKNAIDIINKVKPKLVIITGFGMKMLKADPIYEAREIQRKTNIQTIAAKDGLKLVPNNLDIDIKQKTLSDINKIKEEKIELKDLDSDELY